MVVLLLFPMSFLLAENQVQHMKGRMKNLYWSPGLHFAVAELLDLRISVKIWSVNAIIDVCKDVFGYSSFLSQMSYVQMEIVFKCIWSSYYLVKYLLAFNSLVLSLTRFCKLDFQTALGLYGFVEIIHVFKIFQLSSGWECLKVAGKFILFGESAPPRCLKFNGDIVVNNSHGGSYHLVKKHSCQFRSLDSELTKDRGRSPFPRKSIAHSVGCEILLYYRLLVGESVEASAGEAEFGIKGRRKQGKKYLFHQRQKQKRELKDESEVEVRMGETVVTLEK
ncbi:hypothetical protein Csa_004160 [Cucumis sativus]|nr:hypothetical protein Csa_004160 [Cucumis sativus]